jgi:hypothetical protein
VNRPLIITDEARRQATAAIERALKHPIPLDVIKQLAVPLDQKMLTLEDRKKAGAEKVIRPASEHVLIPYGYRASISFEHQPDGLARHLSVSVDTPGRVPTPEAVEMIAKVFGFRMQGIGSVWLEEFDPGHHAVNVVEFVDQVEPGHA